MFAVGGVGIGDVECEVELAVGDFAIDDVLAFGSFVIALALFGADGLGAEGDFIGLENLRALHEGKGAGGFDDEDAVGSGERCGLRLSRCGGEKK